MKVDNKLNKNVKTSGGTSTVNMRLDEESMGFFLKTFSDSIYSDKIGSVVREITSNCFDSHIEAGVDVPVKIEIGSSDAFGTASDIIEFTDYGVGLSPDRIKNIYSVYFKSTKREENKEIGGFGIGAKSPLSYVDTFSVLTRFDGVEYNYIIYRGEKSPVIDLVSETETTKRNGTTVTIPIKDMNDLRDFKSAIRKQLRFFDNIDYVNCDMNNDYSIVKGDHIIYRVEDGTPKHSRNTLYACLGKVAYPLDIDLLYDQGAVNVSGYDIDTPIALNFEIGDLSVTINREQLEYTKPNVEVIKKKFQQAKDELEELQEEDIEASNVFEFFLSLGNNKDTITLNGMTISIRGLGKAVGKRWTPFEGAKFSNVTFALPLYIPSIIAGSRLVTSDVEGKTNTPTNTLLMLDALTKDVSETLPLNYGRSLSLDMSEIQLVRMSTSPSKRQLIYIQEQFPNKKLYVVRQSDIDTASFKRTITGLTIKHPPEYASEVEFYEQVVHDEIMNAVLEVSVKYEDYVPTDKWISEYLENLKNNRLNQTYTSKEEVTIRDCKITSSSQYSQVSPQFTMDSGPISTKQKQLAKQHMFIYGMNTDSDVLGNVRGLLDMFKCWIDENGGSNMYYGYASKASVVKIAKQNQKYFIEMPNSMTISDFMAKFKNRARQVLVMRTINKRRVEIENMKTHKYLLPAKVHSILQDVMMFMDTFSARGDEFFHFGDHSHLRRYRNRSANAPYLTSDFQTSLDDFINEVADMDHTNPTAFCTFKDSKTGILRTVDIMTRYRELMAWLDTYPLISMLNINEKTIADLPDVMKDASLYMPMTKDDVMLDHITNNKTIGKDAFRQYILTSNPSTLNYE